ncbi:MAG TPA: 6-bladed beta-propeller, partial [Acidobacteriota bacterium]
MKDPTGFLRPPSASAAAPAIALAMVLSVTACSDPLEFPAWTVPPPEGTPLREYAGVPLGERGEHIELIEDLVIGERGDDGNYRLYDAAGPVVDSEGNFYVLDAGNYRAQVFDASGEYVRTLGRQGQGPGELTQPRAVVIAGDRIVVLDS